MSATRDRTLPGAPALDRVPSPALVLTAIASVQFGSAVAAKLFAQVGPGGAVLLRLISSSVMLGVLWRPRVRGLSRRQVTLIGLFGLVLGGMNITFYQSLARIPLGVAVTIEFVGPLTVAVLGSRRPRDLVWVALAAGGILALTHGGIHHLDGLGVAFALIAGGFWGAYIHVNARVGRAFQGGQALALAMVVAAAVALPVGLVQGGSNLVSVHALLVGSAVGLLSSTIPYSLELEALRRIVPSVFGVLMSLEPAVAALAGLIVLGQGLPFRAALGIALVVAASVGASRRAREAPVDG